jgi:hypothetical protein
MGGLAGFVPLFDALHRQEVVRRPCRRRQPVNPGFPK